MKRLFLILVFLAGFLHSFSQQDKKDITSLLAALHSAKEPSEKAAALTGIASFYYFADSIDKSILYAKELLAVGKEAALNQAIGTANILLGVNYGAKNNILLAKQYLLPYKDITRIPSDTPVYRVMFVWYANFYNSSGDYDQSINYALKVLALRKPGETAKIANDHAFLGDMYYTKGDLLHARKHYQMAALFLSDNALLILNIGKTFSRKGREGDSVLFYANRALELTRRLANKKTEADCHFTIGHVYYLRQDRREAESHYIAALNLFRLVNDPYNTAVALNNIGIIHQQRADYPEAFRLFNESLKIAESMQHRELLLANYNDMATALVSNHDYQKALTSLFKALEVMGGSDSLKVRGDIEANIAAVYLYLDDTVNAKKHFANALKISGRDEAFTSPGSVINNLSHLYSLQHAYKQSIELIHRAINASIRSQDSSAVALSYTSLGKVYLEMSKDTNRTNWPDSLLNLQAEVLQQRAAGYLNKATNYYRKKGIYEHLHEGFRLLAEAQDSTGDYKAALVNYRNYVSARDSAINLEKIKAFAEMKSQFEIEKNESLAKARLQSWLIIGGVIILAIALVFYFYRRKENSRFKLELSALKQEALNAQMSDHFIGNTMDSINAFIGQNDQQSASKYLILFSRLIRKVLENSSLKLIPLSEDIDVLRSYIELEKLRFSDGFDYSIVIDASIDAGNTLVPPMVLQVLAENGIKHGLTKREGGQLSVKIDRKGNTIVCQVADNGAGREATTGSFGKDRKSMGSSLAKRLLQATSRNKELVAFEIRDIVDHNNMPAGTAVEFTLPYIPVE